MTWVGVVSAKQSSYRLNPLKESVTTLVSGYKPPSLPFSHRTRESMYEISVVKKKEVENGAV